MKLIIDGMHCDACKALIKMELEENELGNHVDSIELSGNDQGTISITNSSKENLKRIKDVINSMDGYRTN